MQRVNMQICSLLFQGEYEFSPEILDGKLAEVVYKSATGKIKGIVFKISFEFCAIKM